MKRKINISKIITYILLIFFSIYAWFPLIWMGITSLKPEHLTKEWPPKLIPSIVTFDGYKQVINETLMLRYILNTMLYAIATIIVVAVLASLAGYGFSRYKNLPGRKVLLVGMVVCIMISGISRIIPLYLMMLELGLINNVIGLILVYVSTSLPICTWLMKTYFDQIPTEIDESALLDGCSRGRVLWNIVLPLSKPGLISASMFTFVSVWHDYIYNSTLITNRYLRNIPVGIYVFFTERGIEWGKLGAAIILAAIPVIITFFIFQKWFTPGLTSGSIK